MDLENTKLALPKGVVFSYSNLDAFETCPRNYQATNVTKEVPFTGSPAMDFGKITHKQLEDYVMQGTPLPLGLTALKKLIDKLTIGAEAVYPERKVALSWDLRSVGFFHDDVALRGVIDLTILSERRLVIIDYKTSSEPRETFLQLRMNALTALQEFPQYDTVLALYAYTKHPARTMAFARGEIPALVQELYPRVERMRLAKETGVYPLRASWKCGFCPLISCPNYKERR